MKLFDNGLEDMGGGALVGVGALILGPVVLPWVASGLKGLTKATIKGGLVAYNKTRLAVAETWEEIEGIAAEAKAEMSQAPERQETPERQEETAM